MSMARLRQGMSRCWNFWFGPIDPIRLDTFRLVFTFSLLVYMLARWPYANEWLTASGFHVSAQGFRTDSPVVPPIPAVLLPWCGVALFGSIVAVLVGWQTRWTIWLVWGCLTYATLVDRLAAFTLNKLFVVAFLVLALVPQGTSWSLHRTAPHPQSAWPLRLLQMTLLVQYFTAGWCKAAHGDWLRNPDVLWSQVQGAYCTPVAAWLLQNLPRWVWTWMQHAALSFELLSPVLFILRPLRLIGVLWGLGFLLLIALTMHQLIYFSLQMSSFYVLFFDEAFLHNLKNRFTQQSQ